MRGLTTVDQAQMRAVTKALSEVLADALIALFLHGSAVVGGLRPQSDLDIMAVVDRPLTEGQRRDLLSALLRLSARYPSPPGGPRCLELIVFDLADLTKGPRRGGPLVRNVFTYGEWLRAGFEAGAMPCPARLSDHILILAQARLEARALLGPEAAVLLPAISDDEIRMAMRGALPDLISGLHGDERNVILTLARMWFTAATGAFAPKDVAAAWALPQLPKAEAAVLRLAREGYLGVVHEDWQNRKAAAQATAAQLHRRIAMLL